jgi:hypothetical protein
MILFPIGGVQSGYNQNYRLVLAVCASVTFIVLSLATLMISILVYRRWKLQKSKTNIV